MDGKPYTITLDDNYTGGSTKAMGKGFVLPNVTGETRMRSGYTFRGWNTRADGTGDVITTGGNAIMNLTGAPTLGGEMVLYAQWAQDLTVTGTVSVADHYFLSGVKTDIYANDIPDSVTVVLKRVDGTASGAIIREVTVDTFTAVEDYRNFTYSFAGVPDNGSQYYIELAAINYQ